MGASPHAPFSNGSGGRPQDYQRLDFVVEISQKNAACVRKVRIGWMNPGLPSAPRVAVLWALFSGSLIFAMKVVDHSVDVGQTGDRLEIRSRPNFCLTMALWGGVGWRPSRLRYSEEFSFSSLVFESGCNLLLPCGQHRASNPRRQSGPHDPQ